MKNKKSIIIIVAVALVAFALGSLISGGEQQPVTETEHNHSSEPTLWTCSMHPQIKLPEAGKCPICFMDLIPLVDSGEGLAPNQIKLSPSAIALAHIQTSEVQLKDPATTISLPGKIVVDEDYRSELTARYKGRIDKLYIISPGEKVRVGQKLARIYSPEIIALHDELLQSKKLVASNSDSNSLVVRSAKQTIASAKEKLRLLDISSEQIEQLYNRDDLIEDIDLLAIAGGTVVELNAKEGAYLKVGEKLMTIADFNHLWVEFEAYEADLGWLKKNQTVQFTVNSLPGDKFNGKVIFIDAKVDPAKRTTVVRVAVDNKSGKLKPDMLANGKVYVNGRSSGTPKLLIPASAPLITGERAVVYVETKADDSSAVYEGREISLGPKSGDFYIITSGLEAGEQVVTNGAFKIDSELQIQAKPSMMAPPAETNEMHAHHDMAMNESETMASTSEEKPKKESKATIEALTPVYNAYFKTQMALAHDSLDVALVGYMEVNSAVKNVDMTLFSHSGHLDWMRYYKQLLTVSESGSTAKDIATARIYFQNLSNTMIEMHERFGHADDVVYYLTFCPMAFDNTGAYWLQTEDIIWNSYWGAKMLRCGSIKDTLEAINN